jgi:hypothetical protein
MGRVTGRMKSEKPRNLRDLMEGLMLPKKSQDFTHQSLQGYSIELGTLELEKPDLLLFI